MSLAGSPDISPATLPFLPKKLATRPSRVFTVSFPPCLSTVSLIVECEAPPELLERIRVRLVKAAD